MAVAWGLVDGKAGLVLSLAADTPSELPSRVCVAGELSVVLPSPPSILVVESVASGEVRFNINIFVFLSFIMLFVLFVSSTVLLSCSVLLFPFI